MAALAGAALGGAVTYGGAKVLRGGLRKAMGRSWKRSHLIARQMNPQLDLFPNMRKQILTKDNQKAVSRTLQRITRNEASDFRDMMRAVKPKMFGAVGAIGGAVAGVRVNRQKATAPPPTTRISVVTASPIPSTLKNPASVEGTVTTQTIPPKMRRQA